MAKEPLTVGKYSDVTLIARGGMGAVYKAMHPTLNRPVILKKLTLRGKSTFGERFKREARILMDFHHDDIVTVFDHFKQGSSFFIVMEYVEGLSLEGLIKEHRYLDSIISAYILLHASKALGYAHNRGVVHRDIKPANILLSRDGAVKLADFGIAASAEDTDSGLTSEGMTLGTPSYMAPEQFENSRNVDGKADIYSLGVMAYEMSTGKRPFPGAFTPELISAKHKGKYPRPQKYVPGIAKPLLQIIRKAMHARPKRRYSTVDPLIRQARKMLGPYRKADLREYMGALVRGEKDVHPPVPRKRIVRRIVQYAAGVFCLGLILFSAYKSTLIQPFFHNESYGRLRIEVELPGVDGAYSDIPVSVQLFSDDGDEIPMVAEPVLFPVPAQSDESNPKFTTLPLYILEGGYRMKTTWGGHILWRSFVQPGQKKIKDQSGTWAHTERVLVSVENSYAVNLKLQVNDAITGRSIINSARIVAENSDGENFDISHVTVTSGRVWKFRITADGYVEQLYSLYVKPEETNLTLAADLLPQPVSVSLIDLPDGTELELNDSTFIRTYSRNSEAENYALVPVRMQRPYPQEILLPPGNYRLTAKLKKTQKSIDFSASSEEKVRLRFSFVDDVLSIEKQ